VEYDLGLTKYGVDVEDMQHPLAPARIFRGWIEDWEVPLLKKNDQVVEAKLLTKYHGLKLYCPKDKIVYTVLSFNLELQRDRKSRGWSLLTVPPEYVPDDSQDDSIIGFVIDDETTSMISETEQDPKMNIEIPYIHKYQTVPISIFKCTTTSRDKKYGYRVNYGVIYDYHDYRASVVTRLPGNQDYRVNYRVKNHDYRVLP
jgi:hypothetical protein